MHERESREWKRNEKKSKYFLVFCFSQWSNVASIASPCANGFVRREEKNLELIFHHTAVASERHAEKCVDKLQKQKHLFFG